MMFSHAGLKRRRVAQSVESTAKEWAKIRRRSSRSSQHYHLLAPQSIEMHR